MLSFNYVAKYLYNKIKTVCYGSVSLQRADLILQLKVISDQIKGACKHRHGGCRSNERGWYWRRRLAAVFPQRWI